MSRVEGTERLRAGAPRWTLAGDRDLLDALQALHKGVVCRCVETGVQLEQMTDALHAAGLALHDVNNRFMALSNRQFVESRVLEDDSDAGAAEGHPAAQHAAEVPTPRSVAELDLQKLKQSLKVLDSLHEAVTILRDSDSDSDSDGDGDIARVLLKPRDLYRERRLPHVIGTRAWRDCAHAGLVAEDSDDGDSDSAMSRDSRVSRESRDTRESHESRDTEESRDSPDSRRDRPQPDTLPVLIPAPQHTEAARAPLVYRPPAPPAPPGELFRASPPPLSAGSPSPSSEEGGSDDDMGGDIFAELRRAPHHRPQPAGHPQPSAQPHQHDDIFSDFVDKKPVGGVPVYGAVLRHDTQTSTQGNNIQTDTLDDLFVKSDKYLNTDKPRELVTNEREKTIGSRIDTDKQIQKDLLEDLFVKIEKKQKTVKPQKVVNVEKEKMSEKRVDLFSDNLFDDIDDIFTSNIITKVPVKGASEDEKLKSSLFDDDDDLFADIATAEANLTTKNSKITRDAKTNDKVKSIFEEDDLFKVEPSKKQNLNKTAMDIESSHGARNIKDIKYRMDSTDNIESKEYNKEDSIFDDEFETEKPFDIPQDKLTEDVFKREGSKQIRKTTGGLFDDDSDELFGETTSVIQSQKSKNSTKKNAEINKKPENVISKNDSVIFKQTECASDTRDDVMFNISNSNVNVLKSSTEETSERKTKSLEEEFIGAESYTNSRKNVQIYKDSEFLEDNDDLFKSTEKETDIFAPKMASNIMSKDSANDILKSKPMVGSLFDDSSRTDHNYDLNKAMAAKSTDKLAETEEKFATAISDLNTQEIVLEPQEDAVNEELEDSFFKNEHNTEKISKKAVKVNDTPYNSGKRVQESKSDVAKETIPENREADISIVPESYIAEAKAQNKITFNTETEIKTENYKTTNESEAGSAFNEGCLEISHDKTRKDDVCENVTDIMFEPPSTDDDIFSDIFDVEPPVFDDLPPVFKKSKEPKKSKNVNALFDDDSDDEALFFKKNDPVLDEKPEDFSSKTNTDLFGIFDEPPAIDVDFVREPSKIDISKTDVDEFGRGTESNQKSVETDVSSEVITKDIKFEEDLFKDVKTAHLGHEFIKHELSIDGDSDENLFKPEMKHNKEAKPKPIKNQPPETTHEIADNTDGTYRNVEPKKIGKLKPMNFNINVNTLLPGASPKKQKTYEPTDTAVSTKSNEELHTTAVPLNDNEFESKLVKSVSFEGDPDSSILDNKLSKERPKIQVKRRPSTRRARREAVKKSGIDFGEDSTDNSSSVDDPPKAATDNVENPVKMDNETMASQNDDHTSKIDRESLGKDQDDIFTESKASDSFTESIDALTDQSVGEASNDIMKPINLTDDGSVVKPLEVKSKVVYILNDEDIFTNTTPIHSITPKPEEKYGSSKSKALDEDDDIFSNIQTATRIETQVNVETQVKTLGQVYNENTQTEQSLEDDIFKDFATVTTKIETKRNPQRIEKRIDAVSKKVGAQSKKSLFDLSDEENELFNTKRNIVTKKSTMFDSDDEELFRKSARDTVEKKEAGTEKKETIIEKKETAKEKKSRKKVESKVSLFGDDDDNDDLFNPKKKISSETKSAGGVFLDPLAPTDDQ